jgi:hypothetical protein
MIPSMIKAGVLALEERMKGYTSVILFPRMDLWAGVAKELSAAMGGGDYFSNPFEGIYVRFSSNRCSLTTLRVDTLIIVEPALCDEEGMCMAVNHLLFMSRHQVVYHVFEDGTHERWEI